MNFIPLFLSLCLIAMRMNVKEVFGRRKIRMKSLIVFALLCLPFRANFRACAQNMVCTTTRTEYSVCVLCRRSLCGKYYEFLVSDQWTQHNSYITHELLAIVSFRQNIILCSDCLRRKSSVCHWVLPKLFVTKNSINRDVFHINQSIRWKIIFTNTSY